MDLPTFGMEQDRLAVCTYVINGVRAGDQNGWGTNDRTAAGGWNPLQTDCRMRWRMLWMMLLCLFGHDTAPCD